MQSRTEELRYKVAPHKLQVSVGAALVLSLFASIAIFSSEHRGPDFSAFYCGGEA